LPRSAYKEKFLAFLILFAINIQIPSLLYKFLIKRKSFFQLTKDKQANMFLWLVFYLFWIR